MLLSSAVDRGFRALLRGDVDEVSADAAAELLDQAERCGGGPEAISPESRLLCAEVALQVGRIQLARSCVESFLQTRPPKNQFLVRAYYCSGRIQEAESAQQKADELRRSLLAALAVMQTGMDLAVSLGPAHAFLAYNGSVHFWSAARPLLAQHEAAAELAAALKNMMKSLQAAGETDTEWQLQLLMEQARLIERSASRKEAAALLSAESAKLAPSCSSASQERLLQLQVHLSFDDAAALKKLRDEASKTDRLNAQLTLQLLRDGALPDPRPELLQAVQALDPELATAMATEGGVEAAKVAVGMLKGETEAADLLVSIATEALRLRHLDIATYICIRCSASKQLSARTRCAYVREALKVAELESPSDDGPAQAEVYTRRMVGVRIEALKRLEEALGTARRSDDAELVQDGAVLIWNIALPLLQPTLIGHALRPLQLAASSLEAIASPLHTLRASLHLELARAEAEADFARKAAAHVDKALALDVPLVDGKRPLDRSLLRMQTRLKLKSDIYREAENDDERAVMLLEQVRTARPALKKRLCEQLHEMLSNSDAADAADADSDEEKSCERFFLWAELMKAAWHERLETVAKAAATAVAKSALPDNGTDRERGRLQADANFILAEVAVAQMNRLAEKESAINGGNGGGGVTAAELLVDGSEGVEALRSQALAAMLEGMRIGESIREEVLVHNACVYIWNYNQPLLRAGRFEPLLPALQQAVAALMRADQKALQAEVQLVKLACAFVAALASALEMSATTVPDAGGKRTLDAKNAAAVAAIKEAEAACKWASELAEGRYRLKKAVTACWSRLQAYGGVKEPSVGAESESTALALLSLLEAKVLENGGAADALRKARDLLMVDGTPKTEPELWVRVAQQALSLGDLASVISACECALRPLHHAPKGSKPLREEWKWYALAEHVHAEAISALLKPTQAAALQEQLHTRALAHLATAMEHAAAAGETALLVASGQRLWRHCEPFLRAAPAKRAPCKQPLASALELLENLPPESRAPLTNLRVKLYDLMLSLLADASEWASGLRLLASAFSSLPESSHEGLWENKVRFICKSGGKGLAGEMLKLKDFSVETQARVWAAVGTNSEKRGERLGALLRAAELLEDSPLQKAGYLITLAEFLYSQGFPLSDAEEQLMNAVDLLMECEDDSVDVEGDDDADDDESLISGASSVRSRVRSAPSHAKATKPGKGGKGSDAAAGDSQLSVLHFEQLSRIYVMLAKMAPTLATRTDNFLIAYYYMQRMWSLAVATADKLAEAEAEESNGNHTPFASPTEPHEWVGWEPAADLRQRMRGATTERTFCKAALPTAEVSVFYLQVCADSLAEAGLEIHALLPLTLIRLIAADVLEQPTLEHVALLQQTALLRRLALSKEAATVRALVPFSAPPAAQRRANAVALQLATQRARDSNGSSDGGRGKVGSGGKASSGGKAGVVATPVPTTKLRSAKRADETLWVSLADCLFAEGEWDAAGAWLDEAEALLEAKAIGDGVAAAAVTRARLAATRGDVNEALKCMRTAASIPREFGEWERVVVLLAELQQQSGDGGGARKTLSAAVAACSHVMQESPNASLEASVAQAALQRALARSLKLTAEGLRAASLEYAEEAAAAAHALDSAVNTLISIGAHGAASAALVERADLAEALPAASNEKSAQHDADEPMDMSLETESSRLQQQLELLTAAQATAERSLFFAAPRALPPRISLSISRHLSEIKARLAAVQLRFATLQARVRASQPETVPAFPRVDGKDDAVISAFVKEETVVAPEVFMSNEERALLAASAAVVLAGHAAAPNMRAKTCLAEALYALARSRGWGVDDWPAVHDKLSAFFGRRVSAKAPEIVDVTEGTEAAAADADANAQADADADADADGVSSTPPSPPVAGAEEAEQAEALLKEALVLALEELDAAAVARACYNLVEAMGVARESECARYMALAQSSRARAHWLKAWRSSTRADNRFCLLLTLLDTLKQTWVQPRELAAAATATSALDSEEHGCIVWRALALTPDPLADLLPLMPLDMRVVVITAHEGFMYASVAAAKPAEAAEEGQTQSMPAEFKVSRVEMSTETVSSLISAVENMHALQSNAAIMSSKAAVPGTAPMPGTAATDGGVMRVEKRQEEMALVDLVAQLELHLSPLLLPLLPLLRPPRPSSAQSTDAKEPKDAKEAKKGKKEAKGAPPSLPTTTHVVLIVDAELAPLPFELMHQLRASHISAVSRDVSVSTLLQRLRGEAAEVKKAAVAYAVDPRNELHVLPPPPEKPQTAAGSKKPQTPSAGVKEEPPQPPQPLCAAFQKDVLGGERVAFAKDWPPALLGSSQLPSGAQWQRTISKAGAFVYAGAGSLLAHAPPELVTPLDLRSLGACLLFDQMESSASHRRLAQEANQKCATRISIESAHSTAALLSLAGVRSIVLNQWPAAPSACYASMLGMLTQLGQGNTLGAALRTLFRPPDAGTTSSANTPPGQSKDGAKGSVETGEGKKEGEKEGKAGGSRPGSRPSSRPSSRSKSRPESSQADKATPKSRAKSPNKKERPSEADAPPPPPPPLSLTGNAVLYGLPSFKLI